MLIKEIVTLINKKLAGELLTYSELKNYLDSTIDDINTQLNSKYPAFSELDISISEYTAFPDRFIRQVVVPGAAWYYYTADEEGTPTALQYAQDYQRGLFTMLRDMLYGIPLEYQVDTMQGSVQFAFEADGNAPGIEVNNFVGEW